MKEKSQAMNYTQSDPGNETETTVPDRWADIMSDDEVYLLTREAKIPLGRRLRHHNRSKPTSVLWEEEVPCQMKSDTGTSDDETCGTTDGDNQPEETVKTEDGMGRTLMDIIQHYPIAGELWVHLKGQVNYLSSVLDAYPPPLPGEVPYMINDWHTNNALEISPYRISYGTQNPMLCGLIVTTDTLVPQLFGWTPHLAIDECVVWETIKNYQENPDEELLLLPSVVGTVVRLFFTQGQWYIANNLCIERIPPTTSGRDDVTGPITHLMSVCLAAHFMGGLGRFLRDLDVYRVWFFALYQSHQTLLFIGTCRQLSHSDVQCNADTLHNDLDFSLHKFLAPSVPLLPMGNMDVPLVTSLYNQNTLRYTGLYDGIVVINPVTMCAIRFSTPHMVFLTPLLTHRQPLIEFLATRAVEWQLMDISRPNVDHATFDWFKHTIRVFTYTMFGERHRIQLERIVWQVQNITQWLPVWVSYMGNLPSAEWKAIDIDLQRLCAILDYEHQHAWNRIICNPKYTPWIAKVVVFCVEQAQHESMM